MLRLNWAQSRRSRFLLSCATSAMRRGVPSLGPMTGMGEVVRVVMDRGCHTTMSAMSPDGDDPAAGVEDEVRVERHLDSRHERVFCSSDHFVEIRNLEAFDAVLTPDGTAPPQGGVGDVGEGKGRIGGRRRG